MFEPFQIDNWLSQEDADALLHAHNGNQDVEHKSTGPVVSKDMHTDVLDAVQRDLSAEFGNFELHNTQVFQVQRPHVLHNDWSKHDNGHGLAYLIPLAHNGVKNPHFMVYDQVVDHAAVKLFGGGPGPNNVHHNTPLLEYSDVKHTVDDEFDELTYNTYLTHLHKNWVQGLSVKKIFEWKPRSLIVFHRCNIHSSSDFLSIGITEKIGLSVFTRNNKCLD